MSDIIHEINFEDLVTELANMKHGNFHYFSISSRRVLKFVNFIVTCVQQNRPNYLVMKWTLNKYHHHRVQRRSYGYGPTPGVEKDEMLEDHFSGHFVGAQEEFSIS